MRRREFYAGIKLAPISFSLNLDRGKIMDANFFPVTVSRKSFRFGMRRRKNVRARGWYCQYWCCRCLASPDLPQNSYVEIVSSFLCLSLCYWLKEKVDGTNGWTFRSCVVPVSRLISQCRLVSCHFLHSEGGFVDGCACTSFK